MGTETTKYRIVLDDRLTPELRKALGKANAFDNKMKAIDTTTKKTGLSLTRVFGGLAIGAGIAMAAKSILTLGINMEQTRVSFATMLGSVEKGNATIAKLNEFSNVTPFKNEEVLQSGKSLLAFGADAETLIPTLRTIGDLSAGTGKDFRELASIYGKAMTAGVIQAEEINQLSDAGIPLVKEFAKMFGVTEREVKKLGSESKIVFADLETAFQNMTGEGGLFFELMAKQSKTLGGKLSTLVGKLELVGATMGESMTGGLGDVVDGLIDFVDNNAQGIITKVGGIAASFGSLALKIDEVFTALKGDDSETGFFAAFADGFRGVLALLERSVGRMGGRIMMIKGAFQAITDLDGGLITMGKGSAMVDAANEGYEAFLNQLKIEGAGLSRAGFRPKGGEGGAELETEGLGIDGKPSLSTASGTSTKSSKVSGAVAGVQSKIRNITINIEKLVENINFNNITGVQSEAELVDAVKRALLTAVNDTNIIAR